MAPEGPLPFPPPGMGGAHPGESLFPSDGTYTKPAIGLE